MIQWRERKNTFNLATNILQSRILLIQPTDLRINYLSELDWNLPWQLMYTVC